MGKINSHYHPIIEAELLEELFFLLAASWAAVHGDSLHPKDKVRIITAIEKINRYWQESSCPK